MTGLTEQELPVLPHGNYLAEGTWVWRMKATYGLPLGYIFDWLRNHEAVPDWMGLLQAAVQDGMKPHKLIDLLYYEVKATWGAEEAENVKSIMLFAIATDQLQPLWDTPEGGSE